LLGGGGGSVLITDQLERERERESLASSSGTSKRDDIYIDGARGERSGARECGVRIYIAS
jgi:hypothetical protein